MLVEGPILGGEYASSMPDLRESSAREHAEEAREDDCSAQPLNRYSVLERARVHNRGHANTPRLGN
jgi:hypothetical protein